MSGGNADVFARTDDGVVPVDVFVSTPDGMVELDVTVGGYATTPPPDGGGGGGEVTRSFLPWNLPAQWRGGRPRFLPHVFTQFPISQSNSLPSYEDRYWMKPGAVEQSTDHRVYGGWIRDAWETRPPRAGSDWRAQDVAAEIQYVIDARIEGCVIDLLSTSTTSNHRVCYDAWFDQNEKRGNPLVLALMPDGTASPCNTSTNPTTGGQALADFLTPYVKRAAWWRDEQGRPVIPTFGPEKSSNGLSYAQRLTYWQAFRARLAANLGIASSGLVLLACMVDAWEAAFDVIGAAFDVTGRWGDRDAVTCGSSNNNNRGAPARSWSKYGKPWGHWAAPGDTRPRDGSTSYRVWEQRGFEAFEASWRALLDAYAADPRTIYWQQGVTWSDLSEHAHIMPSRNHGFVWVDVNTYWLHELKEGRAPTIVRDGLYLAHRVHPAGQKTITGSGGVSQTKFASLAGGTPWVDQADVLCFLTAPADVEWLVDGVVKDTKTAPAGMSHVKFSYPATSPTAAPVRFTVRAKRAGTVIPGTVAASPFPYGGPQVADDYHYRCVSSLRQSGAQAAAAQLVDVGALLGRALPGDELVEYVDRSAVMEGVSS